MKRIFILIAFFNLFINSLAQDTNSSVYNFIFKFTVDEKYQIMHINFPLTIMKYDNSLSNKIVEKVDSSNWIHVNLIDIKSKYFTDIESSKNENYEKEFIVLKIGIETGLNLRYCFIKINGEWYLDRIEEFST